MVAAGEAATKLRHSTPEERRRSAGSSRKSQRPAPQLMGSLAEPRYCAMESRCTQARFLNGSPALVRSTSKSDLCGRCEESGLSPDDASVLEKLRLEPTPLGKELKARALKDGLTVQLSLQRGAFWDAILELRKRRGITAERRLPPSGDNISGLIAPERSLGGHDGLQLSRGG